MEEQVGTTKQPNADNKWRIARKCLWEALLYVGVFLLTSVLFFLLKPLIGYYRQGAFAQAFIVIILGCCLAFVSYMGAAKRLSTREIVIILLIVGYVLRVGYVLYTPAASRQHDVFSKNFDGHEAYAWTLFDTGALPTTNKYQFYHPPLNAFIQSVFMRMVQGIASLFDISAQAYAYGKPDYLEVQRYFLFSSCQILSVTYSFITAVAMVKMLKIFGFSNKIYLLTVAIAVLYPRNIQFAGMLNNDALSYMCAMLALLFALRWWKGKKSFGYILLCGAAIGCGMMAKLSSATVCIPIAGIFIYEFIATLRKKEGALKFW